MPPKRPAGLGAAAKAKKAKAAPVETPTPPTEGEGELGDDWADLQELWERCETALKGDNPRTAAPLLRGVLHETDRLLRAYGPALEGFVSPPAPLPTASADPSTSSSPSEPSKPVPLGHFNLILASALLELGALIALSARSDEPVAAAGEPEKGRPFFARAWEVAGERAEGWEKEREVVKGRAAAEALREMLESEEEEEEAAEEEDVFSSEQPIALLNQATNALSPSLPRFSITELLNLAALVAPLEETLAPAVSFAKDALSLALQGQGDSVLEPRQRWEALKSRGGVGVARAGRTMDRLEEEGEEVDLEGLDEEMKEEVERARKELKEAIDDLEGANTLAATLDPAPTPEDLEELTSLLNEALVTLANVTPDGPEREALYARAGVDLDAEEE